MLSARLIKELIKTKSRKASLKCTRGFLLEPLSFLISMSGNIKQIN